MIVTDAMIDGLGTALAAAKNEYRRAVFALALSEAAKVSSGVGTLADVDEIHHVRVRVVALEAAVEELGLMASEADTVSDM